jgi:hypothetical protein
MSDEFDTITDELGYIEEYAISGEPEPEPEPKIETETIVNIMVFHDTIYPTKLKSNSKILIPPCIFDISENIVVILLEIRH